MADLTGFKFTNLKKNLTAPGAQISAEPLYLDYLLAHKGQDIPGVLNAEGVDLAIQALKEGRSPDDIAAHFYDMVGPDEKKTRVAKDPAEVAKIGETIRKNLNTKILNAVANNEEISPSFTKAVEAQKASVGGKASQADIENAASKIGDKISADFASRYGRDATQGELAALFNQLQYGHVGNPNTPETFDMLMNSANFEDVFKKFDEKLPIIEAANADLQTIGKELSAEQLDKLLARGISPERADALSRSFVESLKTQDAQSKLAELPGKQYAALDKLNADLSLSQAENLSNNIVPAITTALRNRGLAAGPELQSVLAEVSGNLGAQREATIAPLRAQVGLGAPEAAFNFALSGAREAGSRTNTANQLLQNMGILGKQQAFNANESFLNRQFTADQNNQNIALQLALMGRQPSQPSGLDYFLQYGLPALTGITSAGINAYGNSKRPAWG